MEINTQDYRICYDPATATVSFAGFLRLIGLVEYEQIAQLLSDVGDLKQPKITLNLQNLKFMNSSSINILSKFIIEVRKKVGVQIAIQGSLLIPLPNKSLKNLRRLMPALELKLI
ncbi:MAG: hypothetical protein HC849_27285 [Oscillatoriales cyanobacterium RU_3_3]|nr:hypothetical protein [Microcoleus sp. SU_5_6]NJL69709.1 hypothetical protein [Microcoleus sp. SM1_3_4]NJM63047.1 hypothetical protein [Oscillatoriales cyanobacterium RU_3_3]NJR23691.1 hypothetical protein [Richelia sp. CSU_2_1]